MKLQTIYVLVASFVTRAVVAQTGQWQSPRADIFQISIVGNAEEGSDCAKLGESLGPELMNEFGSFSPALQDYSGNSSFRRRRRLSEPKSKNRRLVNLCDKKFCAKKKNWQACYFNGCKCTCGGNNRMLQWQNTRFNGGEVSVARKNLQSMVAEAAASIPGCELGMIFTRSTIADEDL